MSEMIYGIHAVQALLERSPERFQEVFVLKGREDKRLLPLLHALEAQGVVIQVANRQVLDEKSDGAVHQGIIARVKPGRQYQENDLPDLIASVEQPFFLILDGVTDPHNLGACLRSADAAGHYAFASGRECLDCRHCRRGGPYSFPEQNDRSHGPGHGRGRRGHAPFDA